jgi:hypothetical protein
MAEDPPPPPPQSFFSAKNEGKSALISPEQPPVRPEPLRDERDVGHLDEIRDPVDRPAVRSVSDRLVLKVEHRLRRRLASQIAIAIVVAIVAVVWWWLSR